MYSVKPIIDNKNEISLPNCMYKMPNMLNDDVCNKGQDCDITKKVCNVSEQNLGAIMDKIEARQKEILQHLCELKLQMLSMKETISVVPSDTNFVNSYKINNEDLKPIVILANPLQVPYSLLVIQKLWAQKNVKLLVKSYVHSSVGSLSSEVEHFARNLTLAQTSTAQFTLNATLIWKDLTFGPELIVGPTMSHSIKGEVNILRYLNRVLPGFVESNSDDIESILDICYQLTKSRTQKESQALLRLLNAKLGKSTWFCNMKELSLADIAVCSTLKQVKCGSDLTVNMTKWMQRCSEVVGV